MTEKRWVRRVGEGEGGRGVEPDRRWRPSLHVQEMLEPEVCRGRDANGAHGKGQVLEAGRRGRPSWAKPTATRVPG